MNEFWCEQVIELLDNWAPATWWQAIIKAQVIKYMKAKCV